MAGTSRLLSVDKYIKTQTQYPASAQRVPGVSAGRPSESSQDCDCSHLQIQVWCLHWCQEILCVCDNEDWAPAWGHTGVVAGDPESPKLGRSRFRGDSDCWPHLHKISSAWEIFSRRPTPVFLGLKLFSCLVFATRNSMLSDQCSFPSSPH